MCEFTKEFVEGLLNSLRAEPDARPSHKALCFYSNYDGPNTLSASAQVTLADLTGERRSRLPSLPMTTGSTTERI